MKWGAKTNPREEILDDASKFPFGKYLGWSMSSVPHDYFSWLETQEWFAEWPAVVAYFEKNKKSLEQDAKEALRNRRAASKEVYRSANIACGYPDDGYQLGGDDVPY